MKRYQKLNLLHAIYITCIVIAELMGSKTFPLWIFNASVAIFVLPITFSINDVVFEVLGRERALSFVKSGLQILFFLFVFNILAVVLPPSTRFEPSNEAYNLIFGKSIRMIVASLLAFFVSEQFDVYVFSKIKEKFSKQKLWLRNNLSNLLGQFVDTTVFMFAAFYTKGNAGFIFSLIIPYWFLKSFMSAMITPLVYKGVSWLRKES